MKIFNKLIKFLICILSVTLIVNPIQAISNSNDSKISIICTNSILADFTKNLLKDYAEIDYIMPAGVCPSHFDTSPSDISMITTADIIISLGWEPWLASLLESSGNDKYDIIKCSNLGEWNIPSGAIKYLQKLKNELSELIPSINVTIKTNFDEYILLLNENIKQLQLKIANENFQNKKVICMEWQSDFLKWLGLNVVSYYAPPESLSIQDMLNISNSAKTNEICAIVDNLQSGTDFGARIASESGSSHVIFTNFPGAIPGTDTYLDMINYNTDQIVKGISTYYYKKGEISKLESYASSLELQRNVSLFVLVIFGLLTGIFVVLYKRK